MKSVKTINESWKDFELKAVPPGAHEGQRRDMQTCFYAGALSFFSLLKDEAEADPEGKKVVPCIERLRNEIVEFFEAREKQYDQ